jgi:hypothetical protein
MAPVVSKTSAILIAGPRHRGRSLRHQPKRAPPEVTLIPIEDLAAMAAFLGIGELVPELLRRNLVTSGINLCALKDRRFRVGAALLEGSGERAVRPHGGKSRARRL